MSGERIPSEQLRAGRRALEELTQAQLLGDYEWFDPCKKWTLHCRLAPNVDPSGPIPPSTNWYVLVDPDYPWGSIEFYPDKKGGITQTFHHQEYNGPGAQDALEPWRSGRLCLDTTGRVLGRHAYDTEPYQVHTRLRWRFERALKWMGAASRGQLVVPGDPYELPQFPKTSPRAETVAFTEGPECFAKWQDITERSGLVNCVRLRRNPRILLVKRLLSREARCLFVPSWGSATLCEEEGTETGVWLRVRQTPVLYPWQAPANWRELREVCRSQGIEVDELLRPVAPLLRDGRPHIALIGFPVPEKEGEEPCQIHWQAMRLPVLSHGTKTRNGFRKGDETGYWLRDQGQVLLEKTPLDWLASENWHPMQISTRGKVADSLASRKTLLLGAGALGSAVAELLVRGGVHGVTIVDPDRLSGGNLVRHTLGLEAVGRNKAQALADRLNAASPHASVHAVNDHFPPRRDMDVDKLRQCDIIIDCTASDDVPHYLATFRWDGPKHFFSVSLGFQARRLFLFAAYCDRFPDTAFARAINPWLEAERQSYRPEDLPWEGIGCWHPVFPARTDDVWMMSSLIIRHVESRVEARAKLPELTVFEQQYEKGVLVGIRRVGPEIVRE